MTDINKSLVRLEQAVKNKSARERAKKDNERIESFLGQLGSGIVDFFSRHFGKMLQDQTDLIADRVEGHMTALKEVEVTNLKDIPAPVVNVEAPQVHVDAPVLPDEITATLDKPSLEAIRKVARGVYKSAIDDVRSEPNAVVIARDRNGLVTTITEEYDGFSQMITLQRNSTNQLTGTKRKIVQ